jgi:hypothetical protein
MTIISLKSLHSAVTERAHLEIWHHPTTICGGCQEVFTCLIKLNWNFEASGVAVRFDRTPAIWEQVAGTETPFRYCSQQEGVDET